ncbi:MAG: IS5 family transposase [Verrucomicrobiota bacterium]|jgi:transposase|nr:IS5 family transposase [Verrucomicrobiota bacterium]MDP7292081.1 IS5 family transposase [Verrucomicrobiota bacterium]|tara:strand:+ start:86 stop:1165 length:1080 start_codon:yes stop_codon:yes gene_type:complete
MRGDEDSQADVFSYVSPEERIPAEHPLRPMRQLVNEALKGMGEVFDRMYARGGRPSIPPEQLLRALLLQVLYSVRSERLLMEQLDYNLLFRWFVGLSMDDTVWHPTTFTKNRERLLNSEVATEFFQRVREQAQRAGLLSDEHFTVDGTLIEAWASVNSFRRKDENDGDDGVGGGGRTSFRGQRRKNETHESRTDPGSRWFRKGPGKEARLVYMGHVLMENRNGLVIDSRLTSATGKAEREAAQQMIGKRAGGQRLTLGADKGYDAKDFVNRLRKLNVSPHIARKKVGSAMERCLTVYPNYDISQTARYRVEEVFGWMKTVGVLRKTRHRGTRRVGWMFTFTTAVYNLVRMRNLGLGVAT